MSGKIIILLGPPGAGKGTQAIKVSQGLNIPHISTGEIMRQAVSEESELGKKVKSYLDSGTLVPDALVVDLIKDRLNRSDCEKGCLLDGFPRTLEQARQLDALLSEMAITDIQVLDLVVPDDVLVERIKKRGESGSGRSDDNVEMAKKRLAVYREQTAPLAGYYRQKGLLKEINGLGTIEEVNHRIVAEIR